MQFVVVTGMSGSGKSSAIDVLEDMGYYCIDNMPPELIPKFANICSKSDGKITKVAFVTDVRGGDFFLQLTDTINELRSNHYDVKILFLDSTDEVILRRYKETRRKHPLDEICSGNIRRAINSEREMLLAIKEYADYYVDTSHTSTSQFKQRMYDIFLEEDDDSMKIDVVSFGFKYGNYTEADLVFDVRCLPNPFYVPELKNKTGLQTEVSGYVLKFQEAQELLKKLQELIDFLVPLYKKEGKSQLVIAFGCTGGKHRSVTFAEAISKHLMAEHLKIRVTHRDIDKH